MRRRVAMISSKRWRRHLQRTGVSLGRAVYKSIGHRPLSLLDVLRFLHFTAGRTD